VCFSAEADIVTGVAVGVVGVDCLRHVGNRRELPLASLPLLFAAHQLIDVAQKQGLGAPVVDALFRAYFEEAKDIGDPAVLADLAARLAVQGWPQSANEKEVATLEGSFRDLGISAVPTFVLARRLGVSGAQPPEAIAAALREAAASMPAST